jgi:hypothetical protein
MSAEAAMRARHMILVGVSVHPYNNRLPPETYTQSQKSIDTARPI